MYENNENNPIKSNTIYCYACGKELHESAPTCPSCGARQKTKPGAIGTKSRATAILPAFFLGGLGAHKFYLGQTGSGILYLLFFWTFIPAIIGFIEFIRYILMSDEEFHYRYCQ